MLNMLKSALRLIANKRSISGFQKYVKKGIDKCN